jgi:thioredoxin-like negative regulator of GroEL
MEAGDLVRAGRLYREALERNPEDICARDGLARVLDASGEHEAALEQLDRCRGQDQGNLEVLVSRCGVLGALGR